MRELKLYLEYLNFEKGLAKNTLIAYERDIKAFFDFFEEKKEITRKNINSYIYHLKEKNQCFYCSL